MLEDVHWSLSSQLEYTLLEQFLLLAHPIPSLSELSHFRSVSKLLVHNILIGLELVSGRLLEGADALTIVVLFVDHGDFRSGVWHAQIRKQLKVDKAEK